MAKKARNVVRELKPTYGPNGQRYWPIYYRLAYGGTGPGSMVHVRICRGVNGRNEEEWEFTGLTWAPVDGWVLPPKYEDRIRAFFANNLNGYLPTDTIYLSCRMEG